MISPCLFLTKIDQKIRQNNTLCTYMILCFMVADCMAAPAIVEETLSPREVAAISMMRTFFLSYLAHAKTVRPDSTTITASTFYKRAAALAFPTSGIYDAVGSMIRVYHGDKILGIADFNKFLKNKMIPRNVYDNTQTYACPEVSAHSPSPSDCQSKPYEERLNATPHIPQYPSDPSEDWVNQYKDAIAEFDSKKNDNGPFLASLLHSIGPLRARKLRHCILNGSIFIGYNQYNGTNCMRRYRLTSKDMVLTGSGAICYYQLPVCSSAIRYLPVDMLNELQAASFIDNTSYIQVLITLFQLGYTLYECIRGAGSRWSKLVMIVFTIMSVLQTMSLLLLHSQVAAFSIRCRNENPYPELPLIHDSSCKIEKARKKDSKGDPKDSQEDPAMYEFTLLSTVLGRRWLGHAPKDIGLNRVRRSVAYDVMSKSGVSPTMIKKLFGEEKAALVDISPHPGGVWEVLACILGTGAPFLIGIWAGYGSSVTTMTVTISWIGISFGYSYSYITTFYPSYFINFRPKDLQTFLSVFGFLSMTALGIVYVIEITIYGYLYSPDKQ
ncbi:hypothetical protein CLU79DRAFT_752308 [Phycomyces nitens]|nr:hypothetical protein CLU79DRAFT_752308 [Phycomyces nitens]